jgi:uncharacterized pyridoxamine 5'-phosphate oxidase family protein
LQIPEPREREMRPLDIFNQALDIMRAVDICAFTTAIDSKPRARAMEYTIDEAGIVYMLTEGGRKIRDVLLNKNASFAIWEIDVVHERIRGLTIAARAEVIDPGNAKRFEEYYTIYRENIGRETPDAEDLPLPMKLIRAIPDVIELFDPSLKKSGYAAKQIWRR